MAGNCADMARRRPVNVVTPVIYFVANFGTTLQDSFAALLMNSLPCNLTYRIFTRYLLQRRLMLFECPPQNFRGYLSTFVIARESLQVSQH